MRFIKKYQKYIFLFLILYTLIHFIHGGIYQPLIINKTKFTQINGQAIPLYDLLYNNKQIELNTVQYGPIFLFIIRPFMSFFNEKIYFNIILFIIAQITTIISFYIIYNLLFKKIKYGFFYLFLIWFNFNPLYHNFSLKAVELWELVLICISLYFIINKKELFSGIAITMAALIKLLPIFYFYYLFLRQKKAFILGLISMFITLLISGLIFGYNMGLYYLYFIITRPISNVVYAQNLYENISIKGILVRIFSGFHLLGEKGHETLGFFDDYSFVLSKSNEFWVNLIFALFLILGLLFFAYPCLRLKKNKDSELILFSLISINLFLLSPWVAWEYTVLLLPAFAISIYFLIQKETSKLSKYLFSISYIFLGVPIPLKIFLHIFPFKLLNNYFCNNFLTLYESYRAYGLPFIGLIAIYLFFVILALNNGYKKN